MIKQWLERTTDRKKEIERTINNDMTDKKNVGQKEQLQWTE